MMDKVEPLELELLLSGIGGQGVQLIGKVMALAAVNEGRHALVYGEYGGEMRGGRSVLNLVIGPERLRALPVVSNASHVIVLHHKFFDEVLPRVSRDALVIAESTIAEQLEVEGRQVQFLPGTDLAKQAGNPMTAGLAILAGFAAMTGIVEVESLVAAMKQLVPSYRRQHVEANERALRLGAAAAPALSAPVAFAA